jgi:hypothetical protein
LRTISAVTSRRESQMEHADLLDAAFTRIHQFAGGT